MAASLPKEIIAKSEQRVAAFKSLRAEIGADMGKVNELLDAIRLKIKANSNVRHPANQDSLLVQTEQEYLACLVSNLRQLEDLFEKD